MYQTPKLSLFVINQNFKEKINLFYNIKVLKRKPFFLFKAQFKSLFKIYQCFQNYLNSLPCTSNFKKEYCNVYKVGASIFNTTYNSSKTYSIWQFFLNLCWILGHPQDRSLYQQYHFINKNLVAKCEFSNLQKLLLKEFSTMM